MREKTRAAERRDEARSPRHARPTPATRAESVVAHAEALSKLRASAKSGCFVGTSRKGAAHCGSGSTLAARALLHCGSGATLGPRGILATWTAELAAPPRVKAESDESSLFTGTGCSRAARAAHDPEPVPHKKRFRALPMLDFAAFAWRARPRFGLLEQARNRFL
jgi:hypothetical protein